MKKIIILFFMSLSMFLFSLEIDKAHSEVNFTIKHLLISDVSGTFKNYNFNLELDKNNKIKSLSGEVTVDSVDTKNTRRDEHLVSSDFFDAKKFSEMSFETIKYSGNNRKGKLEGYLTIRGERKKVTFNVEQSKVVDFRDKKRVAINLSGEINRKDFGVGDEYPNAVVADKLIINIGLQYIL